MEFVIFDDPRKWTNFFKIFGPEEGANLPNADKSTGGLATGGVSDRLEKALKTCGT